ncbi:hypothetical protein NEUTE1DRAFT_102058 [Neurospora tetrasperma FGSC 2508]|uniref:Uncharacterized protein n=1 Tax=Neurospora tetrasperma (strain FGSC 2508 / ATCC MYA-4615 / P0657) TaxID=510951 RepID=F8MR14_NEUT8|nr:uncharacterized protein NEUTE1DRAFT_102058 [Neurospora tetrasperma FGSC 2508]EGO56794.1 hypothetical protein NEUTE1DRAFT_102058 [Neurospora tetrasperma FGSC 2508]EGZ70318.1 hypothetical protein NEUTE2DRAFT_68958 [Neurospora tetrasperma FGSC 2509]
MIAPWLRLGKSQHSCTACQHLKPHDTSDLQSFLALGQAVAKTLFSTAHIPPLKRELVSSRFAALLLLLLQQGTELHGHGSITRIMSSADGSCRRRFSQGLSWH